MVLVVDFCFVEVMPDISVNNFYYFDSCYSRRVVLGNNFYYFDGCYSEWVVLGNNFFVLGGCYPICCFE